MYFLYLIPTFVVILIFLAVIFMNNESQETDPQGIVGKVCVVEYEVKKDVDHTLVCFPEDSKYKVLKLSSYKSNIAKYTKVLIVKYEPDNNSYKVERYE